MTLTVVIMTSGNTLFLPLIGSLNHFLISQTELSFLSEMYQEIEATLTEMESCMRLLFPDCGLTDTQLVCSSPSTSLSANACPSDDQQPCCSKDVKVDRKGGKKQKDRSSKNETGNRKEKNPEIDKGKMEQKRSSLKEAKEKCSNNVEREGEKKRNETEQEEEKEGTVEDGEEIEKGNIEEEDEDEMAFDGDIFIRNAGLISHSYSLDINLSPGG